MSLDLEKIIRQRELTAFAVKQAAVNVLAFPAAANALRLTGAPTPNQQPEYSDSEELADTRSIVDQFREAFKEGSTDVSHYLRPSGAKGTAPLEDVLMECALGAKTINAATSVVYSLAKIRPTFSLWLVYADNLVVFLEGCTSNLSIEAKKQGSPKAAHKLTFRRLGIVGQSKVSGAHLAADNTVQLVAGGADFFDVGGRVKFGANDNAGAGYEITAVGADLLTISPALTANVDDQANVAPFMPTPAALGAGSTVMRGGTAVLKFDDAPTTATSFSLTAEESPEWVNDEWSGTADEFPTDVIDGERKPSISVEVKLRAKLLNMWKRARGTATVVVNFALGDTDGKRVEINAPKWRPQVPDISVSGKVFAAKLNGSCRPTNGEDEYTITYK